jgi:hypothetical protein
MNVTFRVDRNGLAHVCQPGWLTALCGAQCTTPITRGAPCGRCLDLAAERLTAEVAR